MSNTMKKKTFKKGSTPAFEYLGQLPLEGVELVNSGDEGDKKYGFQVLLYFVFLPLSFSFLVH
jgi:hypothetical protein